MKQRTASWEVLFQSQKDLFRGTLRDDGWRAFRVEEGPLDFSLVGILARISAVLAENQIGIFAVSTFNTDYILVKKDNFPKAQKALISAGYIVI